MVKRIFSGMMAVVVFMSGFNMHAITKNRTEDRVYAATLENGVVDPVEPTDDERWNLVWHDEFNDGALNTKIWEQENDANSKYNSELQYYTTDGNNIEFGAVEGETDNEKLIIVAKMEETENADLAVNDETGEVVTGTKYYTSARLNTFNKVWFNPGDTDFTKPDDVEVVNCTKIEARIKMPAFAGSWPAFWMMGTVGDYPNNGEIDVVETINGSNIAYGTAHWAGIDGNTSSSGSNIAIDITGWHTYTVIWTDTNVEWYVDDMLFHRVNVANRENMASLFGPQYLLLNLAIGGEMTGLLNPEDIDQEAFELGASQLEVDFVRAYAAVSQEEGDKDTVIVRHDFVTLAPDGLQGSVGEYDGASGNITTSDNGFVANITNNGPNVWDAQVMLMDVPYIPNQTYTLTGTLVSDVGIWVPIIINYDGRWYTESGVWLDPGIPKNIDYSFTVPGNFTEQLDIYIQFGGNNDYNNSPVNITGTNLSMVTETEMEIEELVEKHYTGFTSSGYGSDTVANITTDQHGFVADITSAGNDIWASQAKITDIDYYPGNYHTFVSTITSDVDRTVVVKFEGTGTESLGEDTLELKAGETITYSKDIYIDSNYEYREDNNVDIIFALGGGMEDASASSTITVTDASLYPTDTSNVQTLKYYTEVGQKIDITVPEIASRKSIIVPITAKVWEELNVKLDYTNVTGDSSNTGKLETNYDNLQEIDFTASQTGVDAYAVKFNYVNKNNIPEFRATETVNLVINNYAAPDKIYVLDYGLPVNLMGGDNDLYAINPTADIASQYKAGYNQISVKKLGAKKYVDSNSANTRTYSYKDFQRDEEFNGTQGSVKNVISTLDNTNMESITYTPNKFMSDVDEFYYGMQVFEMGYPIEGVETDYTNATPVMTGNVQVMPASIVYYEDNYGTVDNDDLNNSTGIIYSGNYQEVGKNGNAIYQNNSLEVQYGHDEVYIKGDDKYSNGTAHEMSSNSTAVFKFRGTGLDIMSRATSTTGYIGVVIYENNEKATITSENNVLQVNNADPVKSILINTYYSSGDIYQVPVISWKNDDNIAKDYIVKIISVATATQSIFIDGIRIYNPMKGNAIAEDQYNNNDELNAEVKEIRSMILGADAQINYQNPLESVIGDNQEASLVKYSDDGNGNYFMAGKTVVEAYYDPEDSEGTADTTVTSPDIVQGLLSYVVSGPNNELYIGDGYGFGFELLGNASTLQVGVKKVTGTYNNSANNGAVVLEYLDSNNTWQKIADITSATEIYYRIQDLDFYTVSNHSYVILRAIGGTLSFTSMKANDCTFAPLSTLITDNAKLNEQLTIDNLKFASSAQNPIKTGSHVKFTVVTNSDVKELIVGTGSDIVESNGKITGKIDSSIAIVTIKDYDSAGEGKIKWEVKMYVPSGEKFATDLYLMGYDQNGDYSYLLKLN